MSFGNKRRTVGGLQSKLARYGSVLALSVGLAGAAQAGFRDPVVAIGLTGGYMPSYLSKSDHISRDIAESLNELSRHFGDSRFFGSEQGYDFPRGWSHQGNFAVHLNLWQLLRLGVNLMPLRTEAETIVDETFKDEYDNLTRVSWAHRYDAQSTVFTLGLNIDRSMMKNEVRDNDSRIFFGMDFAIKKYKYDVESIIEPRGYFLQETHDEKKFFEVGPFVGVELLQKVADDAHILYGSKLSFMSSKDDVTRGMQERTADQPTISDMVPVFYLYMGLEYVLARE